MNPYHNKLEDDVWAVKSIAKEMRSIATFADAIGNMPHTEQSLVEALRTIVGRLTHLSEEIALVSERIEKQGFSDPNDIPF